jgi:hypothetical protein
MVINCVPHLAHPRASGVHYLDTSSLIKYRRRKKRQKTRMRTDENKEVIG